MVVTEIGDLVILLCYAQYVISTMNFSMLCKPRKLTWGNHGLIMQSYAYNAEKAIQELFMLSWKLKLPKIIVEVTFWYHAHKNWQTSLGNITSDHAEINNVAWQLVSSDESGMFLWSSIWWSHCRLHFWTPSASSFMLGKFWNKHWLVLSWIETIQSSMHFSAHTLPIAPTFKFSYSTIRYCCTTILSPAIKNWHYYFHRELLLLCNAVELISQLSQSRALENCMADGQLGWQGVEGTKYEVEEM